MSDDVSHSFTFAGSFRVFRGFPSPVLASNGWAAKVICPGTRGVGGTVGGAGWL
ncbi:hypothetical protein [uncultured Mobiluncus sp.]|uniref:hypothetical protein n=1 Tax=uncultured Mobiluncus sp. TaxID=293425 RepID=UPI0026283C82|nr:hypothetical protein [uncultured Mobiluncus sp.]